jgi:cytochrome b561
MHWLMLLLLAAVYTCIELSGAFPKHSHGRELLQHWHFMLGLTVFVLVWLRLASRWFNGIPAISPAPRHWEKLAADVMHVALYVFMIIMPLLGWSTLSAAGKTIPFYGLHLPPLLHPNRQLAHTIGEIHGTIGNIGYFLIGLHAAAALFHHYWRRDNTLLRMLPLPKRAG